MSKDAIKRIVNKDLKEIIKNLSKQLEQLNVNSVLQDKTKNIINDQKIKDIKEDKSSSPLKVFNACLKPHPHFPIAS